MTRVAAIDLGTNSTRLLVADVEDGDVREVDRRLEITRLGEGVDTRRQLLPQAMARVRNVLGDFRRVIDEDGAERSLAFAPSATPRTARRSSARSSGATASRPMSSPATRKRSSPSGVCRPGGRSTTTR
jgi:exopolyphosphatase / guanosine-5'-triphosphate,3'-diphosphate pyrophosphatase